MRFSGLVHLSTPHISEPCGCSRRGWTYPQCKNKPELYSYAAIADEPAPEIAAMGQSGRVLLNRQTNLGERFSFHRSRTLAFFGLRIRGEHLALEIPGAAPQRAAQCARPA